MWVRLVGAREPVVNGDAHERLYMYMAVWIHPLSSHDKSCTLNI